MTVYLVRHGSAGRRDPGDPSDTARRLDEKGHRQAAALVEVLGSLPIRTVASSPFPRCVETVAPLAEHLGVDLVLDDRLAEGSDIERALDLLAEVAGRDVVLCSHGDVIPDLVRHNQHRGMVVEGPAGWAKGSMWTLEGWRGDHFATARWDKPLRHTRQQG